MKQFLPQDTCLKCFGCCRFTGPTGAWLPALLDKEIKFLLKKKPAASISSDKKLKTVISKENDIFFCQFLSPQDNKCGIYSQRPFECRLYPFLISRSSGKIYLAVDENCLFIKEKSGAAAFKNYAAYLARLLNNSAFRKLLKDNPQIIQHYPEAVNIAEIKP